ncbi:MAG: hypothetical protein LBO65_04875 [Spirochaetaceae bacterium]|jgi:hypothetical protein|nr:hypothetical protein [Spirochaetaceae bacterium]
MPQIHEPRTALSFDDVWAALMELRDFQKESQENFDRRMEESNRFFLHSQEKLDQLMEETGLKMQETDRRMQETDRRMKETDRKISRLGSRIGDLIEHLTAANILEQFKEQGYEFTRISRNNKLKGPQNQTVAEIDILLENGGFAMVVEVKSLLTLADVKDHIKRMETIRQYADSHRDGRKYVSSVSGALIEDEARSFALNRGIYVIEHTGDTVHIIAPQRVQTW